VTNLRIQNVQVVDSSDITISFTESLTPNLILTNISILSQTANVPDSQVLGIRISQNNLTIACQPLTPLAVYNIQLQSVPQHPFESLNGDATVPMDGVSNIYSITGPLSADNPVSLYLGSFYNGSIYDAMQDPNSVVSQYINSLAINLARALYDIGQLGNENYLELDIVDEQHTRGTGPFDRLYEEGAYEVTRVGFGPTDATASQSINFTNFPDFPVTFQRVLVTENLTPNTNGLDGTFDINSLNLNFSNSPVTRVDSIVFTLNTVNSNYVYNIPQLGYQILNSRYDQDFASSYAGLADNQIRVSSEILSDPLFSLENIIQVTVQYEYKDLGIIVDPTSVVLTTVLSSTREVIPPIINIFNLQHAPIVDNTGAVATFGGVVWTDPNQATPGALHPAFISEIPFRLNALPASPGVYSVDYASGTVYVYGNDLTNNGTGPYPPLASYSYLLTYQSEQDYVFDVDSSDLVGLGPGNLIENPCLIDFNYQQVLIPNVDYSSDTHIEALNERVGNSMAGLNVIIAQNSPITNVFQIFNETSGEIYTLNRWENNKIYFTYINAPRIISGTGERATFDLVTNELLFVNSTVTNAQSLRVFTIFLANNTLIAGTEDTIGSSINTSAFFTNGLTFVSERWFDSGLDVTTNIGLLSAVGQYMIDYANGVVYVAVSSTQGQNLGTVSYRRNQIDPQNPHLISVDDLYYRISPLLPKNADFPYTSFGDGEIVPSEMNPSDEQFLNANTDAPYQLLGGQVGIFMSSGFIPGVTYQVKYVRSVFDYTDLMNSSNPINFGSSSTSSNFNISVAPIVRQAFQSVQFDGTNYYVILNENVPYLSPDITFTFSIIRSVDKAQLWNSSGPVVPGNPLKLILPGINSPSAGQLVTINYSFAINDISRVVVDYNKGDYFVDYTYIADELLISYEYGDNVLDFRSSEAVAPNDTYYVSYKAGALRTALLQNFGTLVNVPELANVDLNFDRQRYREALQAALGSFVQGPTIPAIKNIAQVISHIEPELVESAFESWTLGQSLLNPEPIGSTGAFQLVPAKYGNGVLIDSPDQTITFPANSNIRLEAGTFETWILPQWNGLDNNSTLTFTITKDGYVIDPANVFVGAAEFHPDIVDGSFSLTKDTNTIGTPNTNKDGVFIYYNKDISGSFYRWYVRVLDGYVAPTTSNYKFIIKTTGTIYDNKFLGIKPSNVSFFTGTSNITFNIAGVPFGTDLGITFLSDPNQFILDFGKAHDHSRLSIYKDASGYMNFRVIDRNKKIYTISADVSAWQVNQPHQVGASWKLNTRNDRDEMHLFIDGFEVPNIIKYGQKLQPYLHEKFRTVDPEEIIGLVNRDIVGSDDLTTTIGSNVVSSSLNFSSYAIFAGDTIFIDEMGFDSAGYTIEMIDGQQLTLNAVMPLALPADGRFSVNRTNFTITSEINIVPNITVNIISPLTDGDDMAGTIGTNVMVSASSNFVAAGVQPGFLVRADNSNLATTYTILQVTATTLTVDELLPINFSSTQFQVYSHVETEIPGVRALFPSYSISQDSNFNNILTVSNNVFAGDLLLLRTLGLNFKDVSRQYYIWSEQQENVLKTRLPAPISLDQANVTKIILLPTAIGPSNSTLVGGEFVSIDFPGSHPTNAQAGRTLSVVLSGTNVDFSSPVQVTINGNSGLINVTETISFTDYGTLDFSNPYISVNYIQVNAKPINSLRSACVVQVREKYPMTHGEFSGLVPIVRYSYVIGNGYSLYSDSAVSPYTVRDDNNNFSSFDVGNYLLINSPGVVDGYSVAGFYIITGISPDFSSLTIQPTFASGPVPLPDFSNGVYQVLNVNSYRSGLQNGYFTFEAAALPGQAYLLPSGTYELDYSTYASIKFEPVNEYCYLGSDMNGNNQINAVLNEVKLYSIMLTDTRVGETIPANQPSITKDFNSLKPLKSDPTTLMLLTLDTYPFTNSAQFYATLPANPQHFQSSYTINDNFGQSLVINDVPILLPNEGILDTRKEATVEFWVSPFYDTANDPKTRTYFDAYGAVVEEAVSVSDVAVKISSPASQILSVKLQAGAFDVDYFAGGKLEIDTQRAIQEETVSLNAYSVVVTQPILQVITVKIVDDPTGMDYFADGSIGSDGKTIFLGINLPKPTLPLVVTYQSTNNNDRTLNTQVIRLNRKLPNQNTPVIVSYIPKGLQGDRVQIFKDPAGNIKFAITASGTDFVISAPTRWARNTWHRVKAQYKINGGVGQDEMRLFLDGYQWNDVLFGTGLFGKFPIIMGMAFPGDSYSDGYTNTVMSNINFKDPINDLVIGSDYTGVNGIYALIDNFRISNQFRPIYAPYGEPLDVNYTSNLSAAFPVTQDLYTTYLSDFNSVTALNTNFTTIKNRETGLFDFTITVLDSLGIVSSSLLVQQTLEILINILKPANSRVFIKYTT
jgi:hypothetical protein